jgi:hypothetical protein
MVSNITISGSRILNFLVTYLNAGGQVGDTLKAVVTCDKCKYALMDQSSKSLRVVQLERRWHTHQFNSRTLKVK